MALDFWETTPFPLGWHEETDIENDGDYATTICIVPSRHDWKGTLDPQRIMKAASDGSYRGYGPHEGFVYTPFSTLDEHVKERDNWRELMFEDFLR